MTVISISSSSGGKSRRHLYLVAGRDRQRANPDLRPIQPGGDTVGLHRNHVPREQRPADTVNGQAVFVEEMKQWR